MDKVKKSFWRDNWLVIVTGLLIGAAAVVLSALGNPKNMGFCIACFERDIAGALQFHTADKLQYFRPEIVGIVLGAMGMALIKKEWRAQGGSSPVTRFLLGMLVMIGALVFLGCPLRMVIRIGGGDLNAVIGLAGFIVGILIGVIPMKLGFSLNRAYKQNALEGLFFPALLTVLFVLSLTTALLKASTAGPGSLHPAWWISLVIALAVGALCQRSRLCLAGGIRDVVLFKDFHLILGFAAILVAVFVGNMITTLVSGNSLVSFFAGFGFEKQPIAHSDFLYNFLGMVVVGWGSVLLGGCPLRQLVLAGEGNSDSAITVFGFIAGAAVSHNFGLASSGDGIGSGPVLWVLLAGFAILLVISIFHTKRRA